VSTRAASLSAIDRPTRIRIAIVGALLAVLIFLLPAVLSLYWIDVLTATAIYSIVAAEWPEVRTGLRARLVAGAA